MALGDNLAVRLPWATQTADALLRKEHSWLPALAPRLPLPVPVPQRLGEPSERFPRPWIITTWVPGEPADRVPATRGAEAAEALAAFLTALHQPAPAGAPAGRGRGDWQRNLPIRTGSPAGCLRLAGRDSEDQIPGSLFRHMSDATCLRVPTAGPHGCPGCERSDPGTACRYLGPRMVVSASSFQQILSWRDTVGRQPAPAAT